MTFDRDSQGSENQACSANSVAGQTQLGALGQNSAREVVLDLFRKKKTRYINAMGGTEPEFMSEFVRWMYTRTVPYDSPHGWKVGSGLGTCFHTYAQSSSNRRAGVLEGVYVGTSIFIRSDGIAIEKCNRCRKQCWVRPTREQMEARIELAISQFE